MSVSFSNDHDLLLNRFKLRTAHIVNKGILHQDKVSRNLDVMQLTTEDQEQVFRNIVHCIGEHNKALE